MSFEIDDKVFSTKFGDGIVVNNKHDVVLVQFPNLAHTVFYTNSGRYRDNHLYPELYHSDPRIIAPPEPIRRIDIKEGDPIEVKGNQGSWHRKYFKAWNGKYALCWSSGTEWSSYGNYEAWLCWRLPTC